MRWAQGQDLGPACAEHLFRAYMEQGQDIGDIDILCRIAAEIGMDFFKGLGVSGVPTFIYGGQMVVQGAQEPDTHRKVLADAAKGRFDLARKSILAMAAMI